MPNRPSAIQSKIITIGETGGMLVAPDEVMAKIENMVPTEEGGLISVVAPISYWTGDHAFDELKGIFHCRLREGQREVFLVHEGNKIVEFAGWAATASLAWSRELIGPNGALGFLDADLPPDGLLDFPTQFVATGNGVVIIPSGSRAYFYDGECIAPLGFDRAPTPPVGLGPKSSSDRYDGTAILCGVNDTGYVADALKGRFSAMTKVFRRGRIGTLQTTDVLENAVGAGDALQTIGYLMPGAWRCRVQFVDRWGNLSPCSSPSNEITVERQPATGWTTGAPATADWLNVDCVLKQFAWDSIPRGPVGTVGRILYRTRDMRNSGDVGYYELPLNSQAVINAFATLPDNLCQFYPDNIPDSWLGSPPLEVDPVPVFRVACMAMGRLWIGNVRGQEGMIRPSEPGLWGTFRKNTEIWPDPTGAEVTGMYAVDGGMLVFTDRSTFRVEPNDTGAGWRVRTLSATTGCVSPRSIATLRNGVVVWLGYDGFYAYDGSSVSYIFEAYRSESRKFVASRMRRACAYFDARHGEYRCWFPFAGSIDNDRCWCYDGTRWSWRTDVKATGACLSADHRQLGLVCGKKSGTWGVWVMDHGVTPATATLETGWLRVFNSIGKASIRPVRLWLRETGTSADDDDKIQVEVHTDFRVESISEQVVERHRDVDSDYVVAGDPSFLTNDELWPDAVWRTRGLYWATAGIDVPSCEVFKLVLTCPSRFEIVGLQFEESPRADGDARRQ